MKKDMEDFEKFKEIISKEKKMLRELNSLENYIKRADVGEKKMIFSQIALIKNSFKKTNEEIPQVLEKINLIKSLNQEKIKEEYPKIKEEYSSAKKPVNLSIGTSAIERRYSLKDLKPTRLENETLKRMKKKNEKIEIKKEKKPSTYIKFANRWFSNLSEKIVNEKTFQDLERDLIKANLQFTPRSYISVIFLTTCVAFLAGILLALFFFFFKIGAALPIITIATGKITTRLWISLLIVVLSPILTFIIMYVYPNLEKSSTEKRIEQELPFATIHMSAISGSMIDPSKIFDIIISTHEYPYIEKEFKKLINEINLYGYDLVSALRNSTYNSPSKKLSELFNGLATTINSGGYLPEFFEKRSQTLLFEERLEQEKKTKAAETFMDIYISLVIAAPMILMILLMMMKISGLGISMSTSMITIIMVLTVTMINIVFLTFLQLKK
ncbi:MAG: type II secretion system F family protein [Nanoarchaeota archaeon]